MIYHYQVNNVGVAAAIAIAFFFLSPMQVVAQEQYCKTTSGILDNGYCYELWTNGGGSVCMTVYGQDARFKAVWSGVGNFVARVGLAFDTNLTAAEVGPVSADYAFSKSGLNSLAYMGVYGWMLEPLIEFYVLEDWNAWRPTSTNKGTITVDGGQYEVIMTTQSNKPSIRGTATFQQWFSIRKSVRQSGHISISEHWAQWKKLGLQAGRMYETRLCVEGYNASGGASGTVDYSKGTVLAPNVPTGVSPAPGISRAQRPFIENGDARDAYALISLTGARVRSMSLNPSAPAIFSSDNLAPGMYYLLFRGEGKAPVTRPLLVK
jgi:hypothetical protein